MPKARKHKRKTPITTVEASARPGTRGSSNPIATRALIRRFHVLIKRRAQLEKAIEAGDGLENARKGLADVDDEIEEVGGLSAYQRMSTIGQGSDRGGGSEKVLIEWLKELGLASASLKKHTTLRLLEVGALKPDNYASCTAWIQNTPIDLRSNHPAIVEQDFLLMSEAEHREKWDIISLSLVLNFVPDAKDRGRMLRLAHTMLRPDGLLFIALPLPCILNSRYLTPEHFAGLLQIIGLSMIKSRWKEGGKMAYWLLRKTPGKSHTTDPAAYESKKVLRPGKRNNFVILL
ncbi:nucleolus protein [Laetiporus sulphureus 93-53]|uniref:25S rRNA adenine-N(1) methyltransferase n=1 Tax=Laetiporus sulphureus 93-53 TaxID=1314785 RepID=A0A165HBU9_9APHY|nr:nucleolus protein [Laetiporus sulphureus 93-53]KZT11522.1 nucleolus protein [Laetiporus sulphureus 93-53]